MNDASITTTDTIVKTTNIASDGIISNVENNKLITGIRFSSLSTIILFIIVLFIILISFYNFYKNRKCSKYGKYGIKDDDDNDTSNTITSKNNKKNSICPIKKLDSGGDWNIKDEIKYFMNSEDDYIKNKK